jgi:hypothetical protein
MTLAITSLSKSSFALGSVDFKLLQFYHLNITSVFSSEEFTVDNTS